MTSKSPTFTEAELAYLAGQRLARLATVDGHGAPQNNPVGFRVDAATGTVDIYGRNLAASRKFHNLRHNPNVALVVDDIASLDPWTVRGVEIRGVAEALEDQSPPMPQMSGEVIRIRPRRVISWGIDADSPAMSARDIAART